MGRFIRFTVVCALWVAGTSYAEGIDFENADAANDSQRLIADEYSHLGVTFVPVDDGATWDGMGSGDPGDWQIAGTNGPTFLGFDGQAYALTMQFDAPVDGFELDFTRAAGATPFFLDLFQVTGFLDGSIVESNSAFFGGIDDWKTLSLSAPVDRVVFFGTGLRGHRFGVDNVRWSGLEPLIAEAEIDVRPGSDRNPIQLRSRGVVPVVLYGTEDFAVEDVDAATLAFGPSGVGVAHRNGPHLEDVDQDGWLDMVLHHRIQDAGFLATDSEACLTGTTFDGTDFEGCDLITPLGG